MGQWPLISPYPARVRSRNMFEYLVFYEIQTFTNDREIRIEVDGDNLRYRIEDKSLYVPGLPGSRNRSGVYKGDVATFIRGLEAFNIHNWKDEYNIPACDGYDWELRYKEVGKRCRRITGSNDGPECYSAFVELLFSISDETVG